MREKLEMAAEMLLAKGNMNDVVDAFIGASSNLNAYLISVRSGAIEPSALKKQVVEMVVLTEVIRQLFSDDDLDKELLRVVDNTIANNRKTMGDVLDVKNIRMFAPGDVIRRVEPTKNGSNAYVGKEFKFLGIGTRTIYTMLNGKVTNISLEAYENGWCFVRKSND